MKKIFVLTMVLCLLVGGALSAIAEGSLRVVTTIFPLYDWVCEIAGDSGAVEVVLLEDSAVDLHSFQPTVQDMLKVAQADVFLYVGGESDGWVEYALAGAANPNRYALSMMDALGDAVKEEEIVEGMEAEEE